MSILKIVFYTFLFITLSPGIVFTFWPGNKGYLMSEQTNYMSIILHTIIFSTIVVSLEEKKYLDNLVNSELTEISTGTIPPVVAIMLFFLLTPGLVLTMPPEAGGLLFSKETSVVAICIHAILFIILFVVVSRYINKNRSYFKVK
jgi:cytochrome bd-type quinol oxidase subunit 2